jgi:hypothetical protein
MAKDILLGTTSRHWGRDSSACGSREPLAREPLAQASGSILPESKLPEGATGYAPTKWWSQTQAAEKVQEFMKSGGIFGTALPRDVAEKKTMAYFRKNLIGIVS